MATERRSDGDSAGDDALSRALTAPHTERRYAECRRFVQEAKTLALDMFEAKDMALHVVERLEALMEQAQGSEGLRSAMFISARTEKIAREFRDFLNKFRGKKAVIRLACNRVVVSRIQDLHKDIDKAFGGLGLDDEQTAWHQRWEGYREAQHVAFEMISYRY
ncbi:hypothetical protein PybrP1_003946, partial [[Pythium] brassicae (nom. inval.)]